eukprot:scaffold31977_cov51-Attheya_sp.AAC.3
MINHGGESEDYTAKGKCNAVALEREDNHPLSTRMYEDATYGEGPTLCRRKNNGDQKWQKRPDQAITDIDQTITEQTDTLGLLWGLLASLNTQPRVGYLNKQVDNSQYVRTPYHLARGKSSVFCRLPYRVVVDLLLANQAREDDSNLGRLLFYS